VSPESEKGIYLDSNSSSRSCKKISSTASRTVTQVPCPSSESILTDPPSSSSTCRILFKTRSVLAVQTIRNNLSGRESLSINNTKGTKGLEILPFVAFNMDPSLDDMPSGTVSTHAQRILLLKSCTSRFLVHQSTRTLFLRTALLKCVWVSVLVCTVQEINYFRSRAPKENIKYNNNLSETKVFYIHPVMLQRQ
jgi:hypothetical protein